LLLQMVRHFDELTIWRNLTPARSDDVRLFLRIETAGEAGGRGRPKDSLEDNVSSELSNN
jgi:hypothetical protein